MWGSILGGSALIGVSGTYTVLVVCEGMGISLWSFLE